MTSKNQSTDRTERYRVAIWTGAIMMAGFLFLHPGKAIAQWNTSGNNIYNTNSGNVGIGTTGPARKLEIADSSVPGIKLTHNSVGSFLLYVRNPGFRQFSIFDENALADRFLIDASGYIGIGNTSPAALLHVSGTLDSNAIFEGGTSTKSLVQFKNAGTSRGYFGFANSGSTGLSFFNASGSTVNLLVTDAGKVGIGTTSPSTTLHVVGTATITGAVSTGPLSANGAVSTGALSVTGDITATGNIAAKYQDLAEWVPSRDRLPPGTVVVIDAERSNHVLASLRAYDTRVAGVISARPGVVLGESGAGKVMVATTGRVKIKVDATAGPIRVGDLLVTSDKEGIAMKSQPLDLGGTPIHRPGTLIGKALEPLEKGVGEILALLSLQ